MNARIRTLLLAAAALLSAGTASAQEWLNYTGSTWNVAGNWNPNVVPTFGTTTTLTFGSTGFNAGFPPFLYQPTANYTATNDIAGGAIINTLIFNGNGSNNTGSNGIVMAVSNLAASTYNFQGTTPTITQNGTGSIAFSAAVNATTEITINSGLTVAGAGTGHINFNGTIGGTGNLNITSTGASPMFSGQQIFVAPTVANTNFTGNIVLNSGNLTLNTTTAVMSPTSTLVINGGTVRGSTAFVLPNAVTLNAQLTQVGIIGAAYNGAISGNGGIFLNNSASVATTFQNTISGTGGITIQGFGSFTPQLTLSSQSTLLHGTAASATSYTANFGIINLTNTTATATRLNTAAALTLNSGSLVLTAGTTAATTESVASTSISGGGLIQVSPTTAQAATFNGGNLTRNSNATVQFFTTGTGLTLGGTPGAAGNATITFSNLSAGDNINGVLPWGMATIQNGTAISGTLVRYDTTNGIVPLNLATDFVQNTTVSPFAIGSQPTSNYRIASTSGNLNGVNGNQTVNAMLIETATLPTTGPILGNGSLYGSGTINLTSGVLALTLTGASGNFGPTLFGTILTKNIALGNAQGMFQIQTSNSVFLGNISGTAGLVKASNGQVWMLGDNSSLSGGLTVNGGAILFSRDVALGAPGAGITMGSSTNAVSQLQFVQNSIFEAPTLNTLTITRPLTLTDGGVAQLAANSVNTTLNYNGIISGSGRVVKSFIGVVNLGGANTYTGDTVINQGTLGVTSDANLGNASSNIVLNGGSAANGFQSLLMVNNSFSSNRNVLITSTFALGNGIFVNGSGTTFTLNGHIGGNQTGVPFLKVGEGNLELTANNTVNGVLTLGESTPTHRVGTSFAQHGGTLTLSGTNGALSGIASGVIGAQLNIGTTLHLDNTAAANNNRIASVQVSMAGAEFKLTGNATANVIEHIGLSATLGLTNTSLGNTVTLTQPASAGNDKVTTLVATSFNAGTATGITFFRGTNLGGATGDRTAMIFVAAPTLTSGLLPQTFFAGSATAAGPEDFATTTSAGVGPTAVSVTRFTGYVALPTSGAVTGSVYNLTTATQVQTGAGTVGAFKITTSNLDLAGTTLTFGTGLLLATGGKSNITNSTGTGVLAFGTNAARIAVSGDLSIGTVVAPVNITGTGGLHKFGPGTLELTGTTSVTAGGYQVSGGTLRFLQTTAFTSGQTVTILPGATLDTNGLGTVATPFPVMGLAGFGSVLLGNGAIATGASSQAFGGSLIGNGTILNTGTSTQTLNGNSPLFSGDVQILAGVLFVDANVVPSDATNPGPLGTGTTAIQLGNTAGTSTIGLTLGGTVTQFDRDVIVPAGSTGLPTIAQNAASVATFTGDISMAREVRLNGPGSSTAHSPGAVTITGVISDNGTAGSLDWFGGNFNLWGANTYTGRTFINSFNKAVLGFGTDTAFGIGGNIEVDTSTSFVGYVRADNGARTIANPWLFRAGAVTSIGFGGQNDMTFTGAVNFNNGVRTFEVLNTGNTTFSGVISETGGVASLVKTGSGLLTLGGANTFTGGVTINGGAVRLTNTTGSGTGSGAVAINAGGRLEGTGITTSNITVNSGGTLAGGSANVGTLKTGGTLTFTAGSFIGVGITSGATQGGISTGLTTVGVLPNPSSNNFLNHTGASPTTLNLASLLVDLSNTTFNGPGDFSYTIGQGFGDQSALNVTDPTRFTFYNIAPGTTISNPSFTGDLNGLIYLNFTAIPEPGFLIGFAALAGFALRRRK